MKPPFLATLALALLCIFNLQTADSAEQDVIDARAAVRWVANNDNCNLRKFHTKHVSETKRKAYNACAAAFQSFYILQDDEQERASCPEPHDPDCRWFYRESRGLFKACSFKCNRQPTGQDYWSCRNSQKVLLEDIAASLGHGTEAPIRFSHPEYIPSSPPRPESPTEGPQPKPKPKPILGRFKQKPKPLPPARTRSDADRKAELFIQHFHEHNEAFTQAKAQDPSAPVPIQVKKDSGITIDNEAGVFIQEFREKIERERNRNGGGGSSSNRIG